MAPDEQHHRASDAEREVVADRLRTATVEGRLDPAELDERLTAAYSARTRAELVPLTADLPTTAPGPSEPPSVWASHAVRERLASFLTANAVAIAVWAATGSDGSFWPKWVLLVTGLALFGSIVHHVLDPDEENEADGEDDDEDRRRRHGRHEGGRRDRSHGLPGPPDPPRL